MLLVMEISLGLHIASINRIIKTIPAKLTCLTRVFLRRLWYVFYRGGHYCTSWPTNFHSTERGSSPGKGRFLTKPNYRHLNQTSIDPIAHWWKLISITRGAATVLRSLSPIHSYLV